MTRDIGIIPGHDSDSRSYICGLNSCSYQNVKNIKNMFCMVATEATEYLTVVLD